MRLHVGTINQLKKTKERTRTNSDIYTGRRQTNTEREITEHIIRKAANRRIKRGKGMQGVWGTPKVSSRRGKARQRGEHIGRSILDKRTSTGRGSLRTRAIRRGGSRKP